MNLTEMKAKPINELVDIAESLGIEDVGRLKKQEIIFRIFKQQAKEGVDIYGPKDNGPGVWYSFKSLTKDGVVRVRLLD